MEPEIEQETILALATENKKLREQNRLLESMLKISDFDRHRLENFLNYMVIEVQDFRGVGDVVNEIHKTFKDLKAYGKRHIH